MARARLPAIWSGLVLPPIARDDIMALRHMKPRYVLVAVVSACLTVMSVTPVLAAPRAIEDVCLERLQQATIVLRRGAGEAFMANCIADLTPTPSPGPKGPLTRVIPKAKGDPQWQGQNTAF